jgi:hypothetical protein
MPEWVEYVEEDVTEVQEASLALLPFRCFCSKNIALICLIQEDYEDVEERDV